MVQLHSVAKGKLAFSCLAHIISSSATKHYVYTDLVYYQNLMWQADYFDKLQQICFEHN